MKVRSSGSVEISADIPFPSIDAAAPTAMLQRCPAHAATALVDAPALAKAAGVARVRVKDERGRMGLGSFKALGAAYVIACDAQAGDVSQRTYATASAGNHGLSVAAGARVFGARAVVFIAETVPESFADRLRAEGAEVRRVGADYEASMAAAAHEADRNAWILLSDSSWKNYTAIPHRLMEGYLVLMRECVDEMSAPTHIFLQAGVGGLAAACAAYARHVWGTAPRIVVVEPEAAPALFESIEAGRLVETAGPASAMGRLDCKVPSMISLKGLARDADHFVLLSEAEGEAVLPVLARGDLDTTPSGGAGAAALLASGAELGGGAELGLDETSDVLVIVSEAA